MRRACLAIGGLLLLAAPAGAGASVGGSAPVGDPGGPAYAPAAQPRVREFSVAPGRLTAGGRTRVTVRVDGVSTSVRARVELLRIGQRKVAARLDLGTEPTGRRIVRSWSPRAAALRTGRYVARLHAVDSEGRRLRRSARASGLFTLRVVVPKPKPKPKPKPVPPPSAPAPPPPTAPVPTVAPVFPVQGPSSFGNAGSRFGAGRTGHVHQGQDLSAAEGTPIVSPVAGVVHWRAYQAAGAGYYLIVRGADGRDLVFMHLQEGSLAVVKGDAVRAGQRIAAVGNTGASSGAHLHFEIWPDGWWENGSKPIDPLPQLQAWAAGR